MSWIEIATLAVLPLFLLADSCTRRRRTAARGWRWRAGAVTAFNAVLSLQFGRVHEALFGDARLFDAAALGTPLAALLGIVVYEFVHYVYHRSAHRWPWLWRLGHQMHHSAEQIDPWGAYFLHPLDALAFLALSHGVLHLLLGVGPEAGAWATAALSFAVVFQHAPMRTPRWLGLLIQRPESHAVHHQRGVHAFNYANLPLWDIVFGTHRNPAADAPTPAAGFYDGASARLGDMLSFRDVSRPATGSAR